MSNDQDLYETLEGILQDRFAAIDSALVQQARELAFPLEELCNCLEHVQPELERTQREMEEFFTKSGGYRYYDGGEKGGAHFFSSLLRSVQDALKMPVIHYKKILAQYTTLIKGKLQQEGTAEDGETASSRSIALAVRELPKIIVGSVNIYLVIQENFPKLLAQVYETLGKYDKYLQERFIKPQREEEPSQKIMFLGMPLEEKSVPYVKIKLREGNPVLTEALLVFMNGLPSCPERLGKKRGKAVPTKISDYDVQQAVDELLVLSDPRLADVLQVPQIFFSFLGRMLQEFYDSFTLLEPYHKRIMAMPQLAVIHPSQEPEPAKFDMGRAIEKIRRAGFTSIPQHDDDIMPENRKEIDYFKFRDELFDLISSTMQGLGHLGHEEQLPAAEKVVRQAITLKTKMDEVRASYEARRLRKDKITDNEFYAGRQGAIGKFEFKREPTPQAKLDDVIGASFDKAKHHLLEIIETGNYPRLMRLTAPGGKVKSNLLLIGPYGCGKTELARAVCADERVIGASVSVANTLTAYMHESVNNVKRVYDAAKELRMDAREMKPVVLCLDEFDAWFAHSEHGNLSDKDMKQIEDVLLEVLDGMEDYNGIITLAMTNKPKAVPPGIMRRFRYVDIVGELTEAERQQLLQMYLERTLPVDERVREHYTDWAQKLKDAPGDVIRKVVDEIHFSLLPEYIRKHPREAAQIERVLYKREMREGALDDNDIRYVREKLQKHRLILPEDVENALSSLLGRPPIQMQIKAARDVYRDSKRLLEDLSSGGAVGFGLAPKSNLF